MVKEIYVCEECNFAYKKRVLAEKCEYWCKEYKSCNIGITKNTIGELKRNVEK